MPPKRAIKERPFSFIRRLKEISMFFAGKDEVHKSLRRLVTRLERAGIAYAVMGGMAVNAHGQRRTTQDVDVLVTPQGLEEFRRRYVSKNYLQQPNRSRRFVDRLNDVGIDFLLTGHHSGRGGPAPFAFPNPEEASEVIEKVRVVTLVQLIQLKLAARRHYDFGDVCALIRVHNLDESFADRLHPGVRQDYIECLEEKRREDDYEAREG
jgi:hypothetical protein